MILGAGIYSVIGKAAGVASSALLLMQFGRDVYVAGAVALAVGGVVVLLWRLWANARVS